MRLAAAPTSAARGGGAAGGGRWAAVALAALVGVGAAACGNPSPKPTPSPTAQPLPSTPAPAGTLDLGIYLMRSQLIAVSHRDVPKTKAVASAAVKTLLGGTNSSEQASGLTTEVPAGTQLLGINLAGGTATVDLSPTFVSTGSTYSVLARLAQVTFTVTQFPTVDRVTFHIGGKAVRTIGPAGVLLDRPVTRATFTSLTPNILVEYPGQGWRVASPFTVSGMANVFEAEFNLELRSSQGQLLAQQNITASAGNGIWGTFSTGVRFPSSAAGPATLSVFDLSAKDGSRIYEVTIPLVLGG